jgi:hypothetical protein
MIKIVVTRTAGAVGVVALAVVLVGLVPFLGAGLTAGAGISNSNLGNGTSPIAVDRDRKGERLQPGAPAYAPDWDAEFGALPQTKTAPQPRAQMPIGCDPSFSPITSPAKLNVYGRCMA